MKKDILGLTVVEGDTVMYPGREGNKLVLKQFRVLEPREKDIRGYDRHSIHQRIFVLKKDFVKIQLPEEAE